ncbi:DUF4902 domain-containing protein [Massilia antarctica]|uniref:DUF4902 domain-containing protein n=1 Tax=Massilia antarctica TaxID=2765360 RepID=UPI0035E6AFF6
MAGSTLFLEVRMTPAQVRALTHFATSVQVDDDMLRHIRHIVPAKVAGVSEWRGQHHPDVWVRFYWYFDKVRSDFVVPAEGVSTNIVLVDGSGHDLSQSTFFRMLIRRLRRRADWQPYLRLGTDRQALREDSQLPALRGALRPVAITSRPVHRDGTATWGRKTARDLACLPEVDQFGQIAKLVRQKFGFDQTLAYARCKEDPNLFVLEENHRPAWGEVYSSEELAMRDPRLHLRRGTHTWHAAQWHAEDPAFWTVAIAQGIEHGWLMTSEDGLATLVLSRKGEAVTERELRLIEPNLIEIALFAHAMMRRQLRAPAQPLADAGTALSDVEKTILRHMHDGLQRKEIAGRMRMSLSALDRHIKSFKVGLGARSSIDAINKARLHGLLPAPG